MDKEYWRGYDAAKLQGAAAENELRQKLEQAEAENDRLKAALEEHEQSFALYDDACRRGTALWRAADPEHRQMVLPDTAALVAWLLERLGERDLALGQIAADLKASWYGCTGPRAAGQDERLVTERLAAYENALGRARVLEALRKMGGDYSAFPVLESCHCADCAAMRERRQAVSQAVTIIEREAAARQEEREACATVADLHADEAHPDDCIGCRSARGIAAAIRTRGQEECPKEVHHAVYPDPRAGRSGGVRSEPDRPV